MTCAFCGSKKIKFSVVSEMIHCPKCHRVWDLVKSLPVRAEE